MPAGNRESSRPVWHVSDGRQYSRRPSSTATICCLQPVSAKEWDYTIAKLEAADAREASSLGSEVTSMRLVK